MKTYLYHVSNHSDARGYNRTVTVYQLRGHNEPELIGVDNKLNSAAWYGGPGTARRVIRDNCGHKLTRPSCNKFQSKNVNLWEI